MCRCYVKEKYEVSLRIIKTEFNERKSFFLEGKQNITNILFLLKLSVNISTIAMNTPTEFFQNISVKIGCKNG